MAWQIKLASFVVTLLIAMWQDWQAHDLAWSMWAASLIGGYLYIVIGLSAASRVSGLKVFVFSLAFFSVHFIGFHFGHSQFMQSMFPVAEQNLSFVALIQHCLASYWAFILVAVINLWFRFKDQVGEGVFSPIEPYKAIMRNHIMIFVVAFSAELLPAQYLVYPLLVLYFFPFDLLLAKRRQTGA